MTGRKQWIVAGIVLLVLVCLSLVVAPQRSNLPQGSTYSRAPGGYGAWYAAMQQQGVKIQRWQQPLDELVHPVPENQKTLPIANSDPEINPDPKIISPITLLRIDSGQGWLNYPGDEWIEQGNVLIQLGDRFDIPSLGISLSKITDAPFTTLLPSSAGQVKLQTSRRFTPASLKDPSFKDKSTCEFQPLLSDGSGIVVLECAIGKGHMILAVTPFLAANAYQDEPGNFQFLSGLVTAAKHPIWVDEFIHGYKDQTVITSETSDSLLRYLAKTPLLLIAIQAAIILVVLVWGKNQRLGSPIALMSPKVDNSEAYMRALAGVLQKANCSEFVVETVGKAEQIQMQRSLGLGTELLDPAIVVDAWSQQTGQSAAELSDLLELAHHPRRLPESELLIWLRTMQTLRQTLRQHLP